MNLPATQPAASAPVPRQQNQPAIIKFIQEREFQIKEMLPSHLSLERFVRLVYTEMRKTPDLMRATPESVIGGMLTAAALGLEIGGALGEAYLLPFENKFYNPETRRDEKRMEAEFVPGYKGIAKLFWQHPLAARLSAEYVCARDEFAFDKGLRPFLRHVPATGDRGEVVAYYAIVGLQGREPWFDVFTPEQIRKLRGGKVGTKGRIDDPEHWMERKTAFLQVVKLAPKSTSLVSAIAADERSGHELWEAAAPAAINAGFGIPEIPYASGPLNEGVDPVTGEVVGEDAGEAPVRGASSPTRAAAARSNEQAEQVGTQAPPSNSGVKKVTVTAILREFDRCGVDAGAADSYLAVLGVPRDRLVDLTQDEAADVLVAVRALNRDSLADLAREFGASK